jgi:hypothetical protein
VIWRSAVSFEHVAGGADAARCGRTRG